MASQAKFRDRDSAPQRNNNSGVLDLVSGILGGQQSNRGGNFRGGGSNGNSGGSSTWVERPMDLKVSWSNGIYDCRWSNKSKANMWEDSEAQVLCVCTNLVGGDKLLDKQKMAPVLIEASKDWDATSWFCAQLSGLLSADLNFCEMCELLHLISGFMKSRRTSSSHLCPMEQIWRISSASERSTSCKNWWRSTQQTRASTDFYTQMFLQGKWTKSDILAELEDLTVDSEELLKGRILKSEGGREALRDQLKHIQHLEQTQAVSRKSRWANGSHREQKRQGLHGSQRNGSDVSMGEAQALGLQPMRGHNSAPSSGPLSHEERRRWQNYGGFSGDVLPLHSDPSGQFRQGEPMSNFWGPISPLSHSPADCGLNHPANGSRPKRPPASVHRARPPRPSAAPPPILEGELSESGVEYEPSEATLFGSVGQGDDDADDLWGDPPEPEASQYDLERQLQPPGPAAESSSEPPSTVRFLTRSQRRQSEQSREIRSQRRQSGETRSDGALDRSRSDDEGLAVAQARSLREDRLSREAQESDRLARDANGPGRASRSELLQYHGPPPSLPLRPEARHTAVLESSASPSHFRASSLPPSAARYAPYVQPSGEEGTRRSARLRGHAPELGGD